MIAHLRRAEVMQIAEPRGAVLSGLLTCDCAFAPRIVSGKRVMYEQVFGSVMVLCFLTCEG